MKKIVIKGAKEHNLKNVTVLLMESKRQKSKDTFGTLALKNSYHDF